MPQDVNTILDEAARIVDGPREADYGTPYDNHTLTGQLFHLWLDRFREAQGTNLPVEVCVFNIMQKLSRMAHKVTRDTLVDLAGYARNIEKVGIPKELAFDASHGIAPSPSEIRKFEPL
jgi:hypothetical protein